MDSTTNYQHFSLKDEDAIRVLRLFPSSDTEGPIRVELLPCRLTKLKLESPIEEPLKSIDIMEGFARERRHIQSRFKCDAEIQYEALSYTWGDLEDKDKPLIYVGEHVTSFLPVTRNCFNALKALRQDGEPRHLWIDAVCINQADMEERSHQVQNMARIYASASMTIIYLGEHIPSSRVLFQWAAEELALRTESCLEDEHYIRKFLKSPKTEVFHALSELLQRPWFRRVWVLQEVYLSKKQLVLCGRDIIPCPIFLGFWNQDHDVLNIIGEFPIALHQYTIHFVEEPSQVWQQLLRFFVSTREFLASDNRDRIFALKALLGPQQDELDRHIDYKKTFEEIAVGLATEIMNDFGIQLLKMGRQGHDLDMPSWVPDWSQNSELSPDMWSYNYGKTVLLKQLPASNQLQIRGWRNGRINELGHAFSFRDTDDLRQQMLAIANLAHFEWAKSDVDEKMSKFVRKYFSELILAVFMSLGESGVDQLLLDGMFALTLERMIIGNTSIARLKVLMKRLKEWRIFLCTETNHIGIAPRIAARGDILVSIENAQNPCLMRPGQNGCWRLISGECSAMCYDPHALDKWHIQPRDMRQNNQVHNFAGRVVWRGGLGKTEEFIVI